MARPDLPVGTWGAIRRQQIAPGRWRARARFRDPDGVTRDVVATGATGAQAEHALREKLVARAAVTADEINAETRIRRLGELWIEEQRAESRIAPQTLNRYETSLTDITNALGNLRISEGTVGRIDRYLKATAETHPSKARGAKVVLTGMFGMAVRHGAIPTNPVRDVARIPKPKHSVRALDENGLHQVRAALRDWATPVPGKSGPRPNDDLADIIDLMLATGTRIGEVLAIRTCDIDDRQLTISGTLVEVRGLGLFRQSWTKSDAGYRTVVLPQFALAVLARRIERAAGNIEGALFASRTGNWKSPNNVRRQWRQARADTGLEWVTPHIFRKTVGTVVDRETDTKTAAAQLGHAHETTTSTFYIAKPAQAPDVSQILEQLGPDPKLDQASPRRPSRRSHRGTQGLPTVESRG